MPIKRHSHCSNCDSRHSTEWACLAGDELCFLDSHKIDFELTPGEVLYHLGKECAGVYCISAGLVGLRQVDSEGHSALIRLVHPGETIGYRSFLSRGRQSQSAEAILPSKVCLISNAILQQILVKKPELGMRFLDHSLREAEEANNRIFEGNVWKARTRVLHAVLVLYERYGVDVDGCGYVELPISRKDMAELVGTAPETIPRLIRSIEDEGLAYFDGRTITIPNIEAILDAVPTIG